MNAKNQKGKTHMDTRETISDRNHKKDFPSPVGSTRPQAKISELTSGSPPLTGEDTIICWVKRRIQPLQYRTRLLCEYTGNADPMRTSEKDMDEELYHARLNRLIKARPNEGRQYEELMPMYTASNPPPKVLCRKQSSILCRSFIVS